MSGGYLQAALFMMNRPEPIRQSSLLMVLATGVGEGATLLNGLEALAQESASPWSDQVSRLRLYLEHGSTLADGLSSVPELLPEATTIAIRVGEKTGTLRQVLTDEAARLMKASGNDTPVSRNLPASLLWLSLMGIITTSILAFQMVFIVPKFKKIFDDFGTELPAMTHLLIDVSDWSMKYWFLVWFPAAGVLVTCAAYVAWGHYQYVSHGRMLYSEYLPRYWTPLLLRTMCITVAAQHSLRDTLHFVLSQLRPGRAATRISALRQAVDSGEDCFQAMRRLRLLRRRETAFLEAAGRTHHTDWALQHLAHSIERRRHAWVQRLINAVLPVAIIGMGCIVGFICVSLFLPVVKLTDGLALENYR